MKDIIRLGGMTFYGYHGVTLAEKETEVELGLHPDSFSLIAEESGALGVPDREDIGAENIAGV